MSLGILPNTHLALCAFLCAAFGLLHEVLAREPASCLSPARFAPPVPLLRSHRRLLRLLLPPFHPRPNAALVWPGGPGLRCPALPGTIRSGAKCVMALQYALTVPNLYGSSYRQFAASGMSLTYLANLANIEL